jgi:hypothetical protein
MLAMFMFISTITLLHLPPLFEIISTVFSVPFSTVIDWLRLIKIYYIHR